MHIATVYPILECPEKFGTNGLGNVFITKQFSHSQNFIYSIMYLYKLMYLRVQIFYWKQEYVNFLQRRQNRTHSAFIECFRNAKIIVKKI